MGRQVYQEDQYKIYRAGNDFIIHNSKYDFEKKHSHIRNLRTAKQIIYYIKNRIVPRSLSFYLMESLVRVSDDAKYINDVQTLMEVRERKGQKQRYFNHRLAKAFNSVNFQQDNCLSDNKMSIVWVRKSHEETYVIRIQK